MGKLQKVRRSLGTRANDPSDSNGGGDGYFGDTSPEKQPNKSLEDEDLSTNASPRDNPSSSTTNFASFSLPKSSPSPSPVVFEKNKDVDN
ncbi:hypothetical protein JTE90_006700 [Oedothorax gibbosus]|uniref:Uncharacterized protein n=1 Tax=Oedothorax gibbosus TaxID=931172 RepID=A0AAV6TX40_9ARAC|nr:hypothetical protein JTE90_006700 [Oedothorax gibbosus]